MVRKASQPYRLSGPLDTIDDARRGDVLFFRQPTLAPGTYTLDVVVHDALAKRAGVQTLPLVVPEATGVQVSSLVLVRRVERLPASEPDAGNPLRVGDMLLYPNLGEPVRRADQVVTVFATIRPPAGASSKAFLLVHRGAQRIASIPVTLDVPDAIGRIRQVAQVPIAGLDNGDYTLQLIVNAGAHRVLREATLRLID